MHACSKTIQWCVFLVAALGGISVPVMAQDGSPQPEPPAAGAPDAGAPDAGAITDALSRAMVLLERGAAGSAEQRTCFTCHNQTLPVLAQQAAAPLKIPIDPEVRAGQLEHTLAHLRRGKANYLEGKGQGGRVLTAGYALWCLESGGVPASDTTSAVTHYLLEAQRDRGHWEQPGRRPPSSGSPYATTYVALRGVRHYAPPGQYADRAARFQQVRRWLLASSPTETEDRVFHLRSLVLLECPGPRVRAARERLLAEQRPDGGWAQKAGMESDAYATGSTLVALLEAGVPRDSLAVTRAVAYLLRTQHSDGSWHVVTRADGFQEYFESGFPHGEDQFISIAASSWAVQALAAVMP